MSDEKKNNLIEVAFTDLDDNIHWINNYRPYRFMLMVGITEDDRIIYARTGYPSLFEVLTCLEYLKHQLLKITLEEE